jgi:ABC-type transport system, involved in lipoprotein release, permease component
VFDLDNWAEIFSTIKKNKMRTFLTGFAISWGIFMFCLLLASGNGLQNGMMSNFGDRSVNSVQFWGRRTSMPYKGFPQNRRIQIDEKDVEFVRNKIPEAETVSPMIYASVTTSYGTNNISGTFLGVSADYQKISNTKIKDGLGRFISEADIKEKRKVAVINQRMREVLFEDKDPVGKLFLAGQLAFVVIGVYEENSWRNEAQAYIPVSTAQLVYRKGFGYDDIAFTLTGLTTMEENEVFEKQLRENLADLHTFDPTDVRPIGIWNQLENYLQTLGIFNGLSAFIWIIGVGTLIAGIIGVSNIMLITVRERTREIGIRKALGAKPSSILGSILMESIFITSVFGYIGMFLGVGLGELINSILTNMPVGEISYIFKNPTIEVKVAVGAMFVLIVSGLLAGYFPAWRATKISPVEAMRDGE